MPGSGPSTPCVWGDKIFVTSADGDDDRAAVRRHRRQGEVEAEALRHRREAVPQPVGAEVSDATAVVLHRRQARLGLRQQRRSSPASPWTASRSGTADLQKYGKYNIQFGCHWTPVLYKGKLYLQVMHRNAQMVVAPRRRDRQGSVEGRPARATSQRARARTCTRRRSSGRARAGRCSSPTATTTPPATSSRTARRSGACRG